MSVADTVYNKIKSAIIYGEIAQGTYVAEQRIAKKLNVSRTPVHQAFVMLERDGWVSVYPKKGILIEAVDAQETLQIYEVLLGLESIAVERLAGPSFDVKSLAQIAEAADEAERAVGAGDLTQWADADDRFHSLLVDLCQNSHLVRLARSVMEKAHRARLTTLPHRPLPVQSNEDHRNIVNAIRERDPRAAREALTGHRKRGIEILVPIIERIEKERVNYLHP